MQSDITPEQKKKATADDKWYVMMDEPGLTAIGRPGRLAMQLETEGICHWLAGELNKLLKFQQFAADIQAREDRFIHVIKSAVAITEFDEASLRDEYRKQDEQAKEEAEDASAHVG